LRPPHAGLCRIRAVIAGRALGTSRMSRNLRPCGPVRLPLRPAQPVSVSPTQGAPGRVVASQTVSAHRTVTVVRGRLPADSGRPQQAC